MPTPPSPAAMHHAGVTLLQTHTCLGGKGFRHANGPKGAHGVIGTETASPLARLVAGPWLDDVVVLICRMDTHIPSSAGARACHRPR